MSTRIIIPDTFVLVPRTTNMRDRITEPAVSIMTTGGKYSTTRLVLSKPLLRAIGHSSESKDKQYVQVFILSQTLKIVASTKHERNVHAITTNGYISAKEAGMLLHLPEKSNYQCKAETVKNKGWEIWATLPPDLRNHIDRLNGVSS